MCLSKVIDASDFSNFVEFDKKFQELLVRADLLRFSGRDFDRPVILRFNGGDILATVWSKKDYKELVDAYRKGMPEEKVIEILKTQREFDSRGSEIAFWNELDDEEAESIRDVR